MGRRYVLSWHRTECLRAIASKLTAGPRVFERDVPNESKAGLALRIRPVVEMPFGNGLEDGQRRVGLVRSRRPENQRSSWLAWNPSDPPCRPHGGPTRAYRPTGRISLTPRMCNELPPRYTSDSVNGTAAPVASGNIRDLVDRTIRRGTRRRSGRFDRRRRRRVPSGAHACERRFD